MAYPSTMFLNLTGRIGTPSLRIYKEIFAATIFGHWRMRWTPLLSQDLSIHSPIPRHLFASLAVNQFAMQPGLGDIPIALYGTGGYLQDLRHFFFGHPTEKT